MCGAAWSARTLHAYAPPTATSALSACPHPLHPFALPPRPLTPSCVQTCQKDAQGLRFFVRIWHASSGSTSAGSACVPSFRPPKEAAKPKAAAPPPPIPAETPWSGEAWGHPPPAVHCPPASAHIARPAPARAALFGDGAPAEGGRPGRTGAGAGPAPGRAGAPGGGPGREGGGRPDRGQAAAVDGDGVGWESPKEDAAAEGKFLIRLKCEGRGAMPRPSTLAGSLPCTALSPFPLAPSCVHSAR
jgi:hypothetical protein